MVQIRTIRHIRIRSSFDWRWLAVMSLGLVVSIAYYAALIWAGIWVVRAMLAWAGSA